MKRIYLTLAVLALVGVGRAGEWQATPAQTIRAASTPTTADVLSTFTVTDPSVRDIGVYVTLAGANLDSLTLTPANTGGTTSTVNPAAAAYAKATGAAKTISNPTAGTTYFLRFDREDFGANRYYGLFLRGAGSNISSATVSIRVGLGRAYATGGSR